MAEPSTPFGQAETVIGDCPECGQPVTAAEESYPRSGWHESCAQTDAWAKGPSGRKALGEPITERPPRRRPTTG